MKKIVKAISILTASTAIICLPILSASAAETQITTVNATINSMIFLGVREPNINLNLTPAHASFDSDTQSHTVLVSTNNASGYTLSIKGSTQLSNGSHNINAIAGSSPLSTNTWGYKLNSNPASNFQGVTASDVQIKSSNSNTAGFDETEVTYGAKVDTSLPTGVYTGTVTYTATAK